MAAKSKTKTGKGSQTKHQTGNHTHKPRHTSWQDEHGIGYATYDQEENYVSPVDLEEESLETIKNFVERLANTPLFEAIEIDH